MQTLCSTVKLLLWWVSVQFSGLKAKWCSHGNQSNMPIIWTGWLAMACKDIHVNWACCVLFDDQNKVQRNNLFFLLFLKKNLKTKRRKISTSSLKNPYLIELFSFSKAFLLASLPWMLDLWSVTQLCTKICPKNTLVVTSMCLKIQDLPSYMICLSS